MNDPINLFGTQKKEKAPKTETEAAKIKARDSRVDEYETKGLVKSDPFDACLTAVQAGQLRIGFELGDTVRQLMSESELNAETIHQIAPSLDIYLRLNRQIERFRQLELRQAQSQQEVETAQQQKCERQDGSTRTKSPK
jgi:hypothetical protein